MKQQKTFINITELICVLLIVVTGPTMVNKLSIMCVRTLFAKYVGLLAWESKKMNLLK